VGAVIGDAAEDDAFFGDELRFGASEADVEVGADRKGGCAAVGGGALVGGAFGGGDVAGQKREDFGRPVGAALIDRAEARRGAFLEPDGGCGAPFFTTAEDDVVAICAD